MKDREDTGGIILTGDEGETNSDDNGCTLLQVVCGLNKAVLHLDKLCQGSKGACVLFDDAWMTPNEFQAASGRELAKDWKRSIKHHDKSLKLLIIKGFMFLDPAVCRVTWGKAPPRGKAPPLSNYEFTHASGSIS